MTTWTAGTNLVILSQVW